MIYSVSIKQSALKSLKNIAREDRLRIIEAIDQLKTNPAAGKVSKVSTPGFSPHPHRFLSRCIRSA